MSHSYAAIYKKVNGILTINEEVSPVILHWRSTAGDKSHDVVLNTINKLQATPATSDKMMLRLVEKVDESKKQKDNEGQPVQNTLQVHMFSFINRTVMDNIKETLQHIIARYKDEETYEAKRRKEEESMSFQNSTVLQPLINTTKLDDSLSAGKLLINLKLQQSLLRENKSLMKTFQETVISSGLPPQEFWSTRIPQLRAFALTTSQKIGPYNVLSTIKPVASSDNKVNVSVSREKILTIFQNYPIVKKAYDDNVPKNFKEQEFWARFFSSKLFRKLRGERIMQNDRGDMIIDRYLTLDQEFDRKDDEMLLHPVKKLIDLEGNGNDDPLKKGHRPDFTMLPSTDPNGNSDGAVDILKGMNRLSEKMIKSLENEYSRINFQSKDLDKEERDELIFLDLGDNEGTEYAEIFLKQRKDNNDTTSQDKILPPLDWNEIRGEIMSINNDLRHSFDLTTGTGSLSDKTNHINQRIIKEVKINSKQTKHLRYDHVMGSSIGNQSEKQEAESPLPPELLESCRILHSTCCEFLKHFYIQFQSGNLKYTAMVKKLYNYLKQCIVKIENLLSSINTSLNENNILITNCQAYLKPVLVSTTLAVQKYDAMSSQWG